MDAPGSVNLRRRWIAIGAIALFAASAPAGAILVSDYLALTDQQGNILKQPGGGRAEDTLTEAVETQAADQNKVAAMLLKLDVPNVYAAGVFPTSGINWVEAGALGSDTIELMVVTTTPQTVTFQVQMASDGEKTGGGSVVPIALVGANVTRVEGMEGSIRDFTALLFPMFYNPDGTEKGIGPSPFRVKAGSDLETLLVVPEPSALALAAIALVCVAACRSSRRPRRLPGAAS